jgi:hypothetical protein
LGNDNLRLVIPHDDVTPPIITAGPVVVHISDASATIAWTTNRPSTSTVEYGIGLLSSSTDDATLTIDHILTLTGLAPSTQYLFRVASTDGAGNGPAFSANGSFTTPAAADLTPPMITAGPTAVYVDNASAVIEWTTDEPSSSVVAYGLPGAPPQIAVDATQFRVLHRVVVTGLAADTDYSALVRSSDPSGNLTESIPFTFRTAVAPDVTPPVIVTGPVALATTDSRIIVAWTTQEASTSGVSFNDGTYYDLTSDDTLTKNHQMTLAGLTGGTLYHLTVSSTDANGNGPTLATIDVTTAADATPPSITGLQVTEVSTVSATISWATNELANAQVKFGTVSGVLDGAQATLAMSTAHELTLNGLAPETTYYFIALSTDAAGNTAQTSEGTFTTLSPFVDQPPSPPGPVSVPASPTRATTIHISWGASTDDFGVTEYQIQRDGAVIGSVGVNTLSFDDTTASEGTHVYRIGALDTVVGGSPHLVLSDPATVVIDRTAPVLSLPGSILADAVGTTATVTFTATATDNLDALVIVVCAPPSGAAFPVGTTTVACSATDTAGNVATGSFTVTVRDVTPPVLTVPADITAEATGASGAVVTFTATATDLVDGAITPVCTPPSGSTFALGATTVSCTATDAAGNATTKTFTVNVVDTTAPVISSFTPSESVLWMPDHRMVPLTILVTVGDVVDPAPVCSIVSISSNEPIDGTGDGDTGPDWSFSGLSLSLRAERSGTGNGRVYTISGECRDSSGNVATASTTVRVPKKRG